VKNVNEIGPLVLEKKKFGKPWKTDKQRVLGKAYLSFQLR
jgi:hypothetical protein